MTTINPGATPDTITTRNRSGRIVTISTAGEDGAERRKIIMQRVNRGELELWTEDGGA